MLTKDAHVTGVALHQVTYVLSLLTLKQIYSFIGKTTVAFFEYKHITSTRIKFNTRQDDLSTEVPFPFPLSVFVR